MPDTQHDHYDSTDDWDADDYGEPWATNMLDREIARALS